MTNDVEKRWNDPAAFRGAALYVVAVVLVAAVWLVVALTVGSGGFTWTFGVTVILLCGGIGALVQAYRVWKRAGTWPIWQGAGWFLFALMLASLGLAT
ncbi:hypothetical protein [Williamsia sp. 1135]|uniref:hypothetical protein n=1 Tax=Williamsia sp. 1135 TaxID=1889262 RepID=UPI000A0FCD92|nr:hypothetical protein [Williamsia sp. 1135]ORM33407.1 hypothetical protein BFL43_13820 [Williamsia sp. 1135]